MKNPKDLHEKKILNLTLENDIAAYNHLTRNLGIVVLLWAFLSYEEVPLSNAMLVTFFCAALRYFFYEKNNKSNVSQYEAEYSFREAAKQGLLQDVKDSLKAIGINKINATSSNGKSALHWAARYKQVDTVLYLIKKGADINLQDNVGDTPAHEAINFKHGSSKDFKTLKAILTSPKKHAADGVSSQQPILNPKFDSSLANTQGKRVYDLFLSIDLNSKQYQSFNSMDYDVVQKLLEKALGLNTEIDSQENQKEKTVNLP